MKLFRSRSDLWRVLVCLQPLLNCLVPTSFTTMWHPSSRWIPIEQGGGLVPADDGDDVDETGLKISRLLTRSPLWPIHCRRTYKRWKE
jgi:hypothetical protein